MQSPQKISYVVTNKLMDNFKWENVLGDCMNCDNRLFFIREHLDYTQVQMAKKLKVPMSEFFKEID